MMKNYKNFRRGLSVSLALALCAGMAFPAFAVDYDISKGDVTIGSEESSGWFAESGEFGTSTDKEINITQSDSETPTDNTITVEDGVKDVDITLDNVNIESDDDAAISIGKDSDVNIELDGDNTLTGGYNHAGISVGEGGSVTITDDNGVDGSLDVTGGAGSAGIGGDYGADSGEITINGGTVTANGGKQGAGIGSSCEGETGDITINGGTVIANGGDVNAARGGAGIGSGATGSAGDITISGGNVTANGVFGSAGIGAGFDGTFDSITIEGEDTVVNATGGFQAAGIGTGRYDGSGTRNDFLDERDPDSITINGGTVTANGGWQGAGIGTGAATTNSPSHSNSHQTINKINITGGNVTANGGSQAAGIGGGATNATNEDHATRVNSINIEGGEVTATGGDYAAGIGAGYGGNVREIEIKSGNVEVNGGLQAAGIGAGRGGKAEEIKIEGGKVTATGGYVGAGIGAGYGSTFGAVNITGGDIVATSGKWASGIGNSYGQRGGMIAIKGVDKLVVLGDRYFAIDRNADTSGVEQTILNGNFMDLTEGEGSNGLTEIKEIEFVVVDAQGNVVRDAQGNEKRFTLTVGADYIHDSFALNLPEGTYYVFAQGGYNGSVAGYGTDGKKVAYVISEDEMLTADLMQFPTYDVSYGFASGTAGRDLPAEIAGRVPDGEEGNILTLENFQKMLEQGAFDPVKVNGGTWTFGGWSSASAIDGEGVLNDVKLVGTWNFTADPVVPNPGPGTDPVDPYVPDDDDDDDDTPVVIPEEDVPLVETPDVEIPEEDVPLAETPDVEIPEEDVPLAETPDVEIPDEEAPLANVPQTGEASTAIWLLAVVLAGAGLVAVNTGKRKEK